MRQVNPWQLPWQGKMVPHAVLDILRGCNVTCRFCYNTHPPDNPKSLDEIKSELDQLLRLRRLSSISILGGEPTLHPNLCEIIRMVRNRGLHVELISNGLAVDHAMMRELADAGLTIIYFHIEQGQQRSDLPSDASPEAINRLREEKAALAVEHGMEAGLTLTIHPDGNEELDDAVALVLRSPHIHYMLVTLFRDVSTIETLHGDIVNGMTGRGTSPPPDSYQPMHRPAAWIRNRFNLEPFAFIGSNLDKSDPRWLSYLIATVLADDGTLQYHSLRASLLERLTMIWYRYVKRLYPMYMEQDSELFRRHLFLNGLLTGRLQRQRALINASQQQGSRLLAKRILLQNPAELTEDGRLIHCRCCPDAVLKNSRLVPVCVCDQVDR